MINMTYVYYGRNGLERFENQADLDEEAELQGEEQVEARSFFKATELYQGKNHSWDLVDLKRMSSTAVTKQSRKLLDESMQQMTGDRELLQYVTEKEYERKEYISIIKMLSTQREAFLKEKREKMENYRFGKTFFGVVNRKIVQIAEDNGYKLEY